MLELDKLESALELAITHKASKLVLENDTNPLYVYITTVPFSDVAQDITCYWDTTVKDKYKTRHALVIDSVVEHLKGYSNYIMIPNDFPMTMFWVSNDINTYRFVISDTPIEGGI